MSVAAIGIICKALQPGRSKTRLAKAIGGVAASELSACFLRDVAAAIEAVPKALGRRGYTVFGEGKRKNKVEWAEGSLFAAPVNVYHRHFNSDPAHPARLLAVTTFPFMMQVFQVRQEKSKLIPAVTHVDGSGRLQTVSRSTNPRYHKLIESFRDLTGIPMVLNTSFNDQEPLVATPDDALKTFSRTHIDALFLGDRLVQQTR